MAVPAVCLLALPACGSPRDNARDDFVEQFVQEGGLPRAVAVCVVDAFFAARSTDELKAFFARTQLTDAERAEFARLGEHCAPPAPTTTA